ncbi:TPR repeat-containing protein [Chitinophaga eiseniae]|uniref:TPR repeat-containing protein n=1 Tax=Chitinophaga eiseniae TaxID=634771 RepID=A0A1T4SV94_9BACT|nr:tetratricopeptide repeat protein [Chitinophaga eiseniae]SKA32190.1 TPR repeat-containing protein [Chitinophaga eiseniae]
MFSSKPNNEKILKVFSGIRCLSKDQLPRYMEGRLTDVEKHLVEQHLTDCDLCFGALQALEQEAGNEQYQDLTGKLQRYIQDSIQPVSHVHKVARYTKKEKTKESLLVYFWLVAFLVIGVASVYVLRGHLRNQPPPRMLASSQPPAADSATAPAGEVASQPIVTAEQPAPAPGHQTTTTPASVKPAATTTANTPAPAKPTPLPAPAATADSIARAKAAALKAQQKKQAADSLRKAQALQKQQDSLKKEKEKEKDNDDKKPEPAPAPKQEPKEPAPPKKENPQPGEPINSDEYLYRAAMVYQQQGNLSEAIDRYKRIASNSSGKYAEMATYQLAICYRSKGQMARARRMFREVIRMDGSLKNNAQQALDSM